MALPRFFLENQVLSEENDAVFKLRLSEEDFKHAQVLRLQVGEHIAVIDAVTDYFECEIKDIARSDMAVKIARHESGHLDKPTVVLVQGLAKGDKMDEIICHATELGVSAFIPFKSARSIVKLDEKKTESRMKRWNNLAKSAAMQSGQSSIPEIAEPVDIEGVCELLRNAHAILIFWEEARDASLHERLFSCLAAQMIPPQDARVAVVVGPEGGFEQSEVETLLDASKYATTVSLGSSILRTETAGVVASALVLYELGSLS